MTSLGHPPSSVADGGRVNQRPAAGTTTSWTSRPQTQLEAAMLGLINSAAP